MGYKNCGFSSALNNLDSVSDLALAIRKSKSPSEFARILNDQNCKDKMSFTSQIAFKDLDYFWGDDQSREKSAQFVRSKINDGKVLIAGINPTILFNVKMSFKERMDKHANGGGHAVNILGMKMTNGTCMYEVRDSKFGDYQTCLSQRISSEINCTETGAIYYIPEDSFIRATRKIGYIED